MRKFSGWLNKISTGWVTIIAVAIFVLFMTFVLPDQAEKAQSYSGEAGSPDTSFFYTPDKLFEIAENYGATGRQAYIRARFTFDIAFPAVYGIFLIATISWFSKRGSPGGTRWEMLNLLPAAGVLFDILENGMTSLVMSAYPQKRILAAWLASIFTPLKWLFVYGSFAALVVVIGAWGIRKFNRSEAEIS